MPHPSTGAPTRTAAPARGALLTPDLSSTGPSPRMQVAFPLLTPTAIASGGIVHFKQRRRLVAPDARSTAVNQRVHRIPPATRAGPDADAQRPRTAGTPTQGKHHGPHVPFALRIVRRRIA